MSRDTSPITTVVCDFGGVLTVPLIEAFLSVQAAFGITGEQLSAAMEAYGKRHGAHPLFELECGRLTEADFMAGLRDAFADEHGLDVPMHEFSDHYWAALLKNEPMLDLLHEARDAGYRMALLTNNVREWEPRWRSMMPVDELFHVVVDSAFVGCRKPDPRIYEITVERLGVDGSEIVFIDDFAHNIEAAQAAGWTGVHFVDTDQAIADVRRVLAERGAPPHAG